MFRKVEKRKGGSIIQQQAAIKASLNKKPEYKSGYEQHLAEQKEGKKIEKEEGKL